MATNDASESRALTDDIHIEQVVIKNYKHLLPDEYKKLVARYASTTTRCTKCSETIDMAEFTICAGEDLVFHFICLFYEHKFEGRVNDIIGFAEISSEHRDLLRTNIPSVDDDDDGEDDYEDHYTDEEDVVISDVDEVEPPLKRSPSTNHKPFSLYPEVYTIPAKEKTAERRKYDEYLKLQSAEAYSISSNPERLWIQKREEVATAVVPPIIKRGIMIDREFPLAPSCFVYKSPDIKNDLYSVTLCQTCITSNRNAFFKMQLLKEDDHETCYVFRSYGRIGTKRGDIFNEKFNNLDEAMSEFEKDFEHLTGNRWRERHFFVPKQNYMTLVEMDYTEFETLICGSDGRLIPAGSQSSLPPQIKQILLRIFDAKNIRKALDSYNFDMDRMPMGKLSALQVSRASGLLNQVVELMEKIGPGSICFNKDEFERQVTDLSNKFYSTLPQSFVQSSPIILSRQGQIDKMRGMIDALLDIQFVCNILNDANQDARERGLDPIDLQYNRLMMKMDVVPPDHSDFELINRYITNGVGATHSYRGFQLLDLIRLERYGEQAKFRHHYGNRKLLWHGSPVQNFPGILMQGLKIAPPDALQTGHAFGRGVYFADCLSKSANYCRVPNSVLLGVPQAAAGNRGALAAARAALRAQVQQPRANGSGAADGDSPADEEHIGFLLLCDVALGAMKDMGYGGSAGLSANDPQFQSIRGVGETFPDPVDDHYHPDGYVIPLGRSIRNSAFDRRAAGGFLYYNEFIVYDTDQICLKYLCRVKFLPNR